MKTKVPLKVLKIDQEGYHLSINAKINGKPAHLVVDTGASRSVFDKEQIRRYLDKEEIRDIEHLSTGLGTNSMQSQLVTIGSFKIGTFELRDYHSVLLDLSHVIHSYENIGIKMVEGVLGSDILKKYNAVIDYKSRSLTLDVKRPASSKKKAKKNTAKKKGKRKGNVKGRKK